MLPAPATAAARTRNARRVTLSLLIVLSSCFAVCTSCLLHGSRDTSVPASSTALLGDANALALSKRHRGQRVNKRPPAESKTTSHGYLHSTATCSPRRLYGRTGARPTSGSISPVSALRNPTRSACSCPLRPRGLMSCDNQGFLTPPRL